MSNKRSVVLCITLFVFCVSGLPARASELDELKATIQSMQKSMEQMQARIAELEHENHKQKQQASASRTVPVAPVVATEGAASAPVSDQTVTIAPTAVTIEGRASEIKDRPAMDDQQEAAPRPNDLTLDPKYRG